MILRRVPGPELTAAELQAVLKLRTQVFIVEQKCPYLEVDGRDLEPGTTHYWYGDQPVAYLRVLTEPDGALRIGRVCTAEEARGTGLGHRLMAELMTEIGDHPSVLDSQVYAREFYERFGYVAEGPDFDDEGIMHVTMWRRAARTG